MLRYFRINDPYRLVALLALLLILFLPLFIDPPGVTAPELKSMIVGEKIHNGSQMYKEVVDNSAPLAAWFHALVDIVFGRSLTARHIIAFFIIFFQSAYIGILFITRKALAENTFIPSFIFSLLFLFSFDTLTLTDELLGSGFLLLALSNLFKEIEFRMPRDETIFNLGLYISLASLFYFPYLIFLFATLVCLFLFARASARKFALFLFGFLFPHLFVLTISYLNGSAQEIWTYYYSSNLSFGAIYLVSIKGLLILSLIPLIYILISIVMLNRLARFSKYQSQVLQTIFIWIGFCFIFFLFCPEVKPQTLIVLIPPVTFLFTNFLLVIRRRKFAEMNTLILLIGIPLFGYLARYDKLGGVSYDKLLVNDREGVNVTGKKVLVLGNVPELLANNYAATPFVNWELAKETFSTPDDYESIINVFNGIKNDPPDVIIDENNLLRPFFVRLPELRKIYIREGNRYIRKR